MKTKVIAHSKSSVLSRRGLATSAVIGAVFLFAAARYQLIGGDDVWDVIVGDYTESKAEAFDEMYPVLHNFVIFGSASLIMAFSLMTLWYYREKIGSVIDGLRRRSETNDAIGVHRAKRIAEAVKGGDVPRQLGSKDVDGFFEDTTRRRAREYQEAVEAARNSGKPSGDALGYRHKDQDNKAGKEKATIHGKPLKQNWRERFRAWKESKSAPSAKKLEAPAPKRAASADALEAAMKKAQKDSPARTKNRRRIHLPDKLANPNSPSRSSGDTQRI